MDQQYAFNGIGPFLGKKVMSKNVGSLRKGTFFEVNIRGN